MQAMCRGRINDLRGPGARAAHTYGAYVCLLLHGGAGRSYDRDVYTALQLEQTKSSLSELTINFPNGFHP